MVDQANANESAIICHDTLDGKAQAVCRGYFNRHQTQPLQIAGRLGMIEYDPNPPAE